jgi:inorganic pyrophosphatase
MNSGLANLLPYDEDKDEWRVIVETQKGSHNKYKFDEELALFVLNGVMPEGMSFPYDFGYLPCTRGEDGDPLDVLILMEEPAFCGCIVCCRLIGVIEAEQTETDGAAERNDRLIAISTKCRTDKHIKSIKDLDETKLEEIEQFFVSYNRTRGKKFKVLQQGGPKRAESLARDGIKQHRVSEPKLSGGKKSRTRRK